MIWKYERRKYNVNDMKKNERMIMKIEETNIKKVYEEENDYEEEIWRNEIVMIIWRKAINMILIIVISAMKMM